MPTTTIPSVMRASLFSRGGWTNWCEAGAENWVYVAGRHTNMCGGHKYRNPPNLLYCKPEPVAEYVVTQGHAVIAYHWPWSQISLLSPPHNRQKLTTRKMKTLTKTKIFRTSNGRQTNKKDTVIHTVLAVYQQSFRLGFFQNEACPVYKEERSLLPGMYCLLQNK